MAECRLRGEAPYFRGNLPSVSEESHAGAPIFIRGSRPPMADRPWPDAKGMTLLAHDWLCSPARKAFYFHGIFPGQSTGYKWAHVSQSAEDGMTLFVLD